MAKVTILGDMVQIKSELTSAQVERVKAFAPEALKLYDEDGNEIFGVDEGNASFSKYGICFCSEDSEGKLFLTTNNPCVDHEDADKEKKIVVKTFAPILAKLKAVEENIAACEHDLDELEASVTDSVVFA